MKGPSAAVVAAVVLVAAAGLAWPRIAHAQRDARHALDRFEPSERGSEWLANESLDLRGNLRPSVGFVMSYARRSVVVPSTATTPEYAPVKDLAFAHLGGSVVFVDRLRVALDLPFQLYAGGDVRPPPAVPAPARDDGIGDLRVGVDARVFGNPRAIIGGAVGVQAWAPTGQRSQWASDGVFRVRPRVLAAGELGAFVWAAQGAYFARDRSEVAMSGAAGVRIARSIVVGPELIASTVLEDAFTKRATPVEAILGAHWLVEGTARIGGGLGAGLGEGLGAPAWRAVFAIEWAPEVAGDRDDPHSSDRSGRSGRRAGRTKAEPDADRDDVPDASDACPSVVGVKTDDTRTNGCPPDTDEDGVDDLSDACPTVRGLASTDPAINGCPDGDRDKDGVPNEVDACPDDRGPADVDPRRSGCPKAFVRGSRIELLDQVVMKPSSAEIVTSAENEATLTTLLSVLLRLPEGRRLRIEGHTDDRGDAAVLRKLSAARASAVAKWLVDHGIDRSRVTAEGAGSDRPIATNETESGRAENRRLELYLEP